MMKTTFSYFPEIFENSAPGVSEIIIKILKNRKYYEISTIHECVKKNRRLKFRINA